MERGLQKLKESRNAGFTLLECLVALLVLSGMLLTFSFLIQAGRQLIDTVSGSREKEFEVFLQQLENEVQGYQLAEVKDNTISFLQDKTVIKIRWINNRVDKTPGTQPLLTGVRHFTAVQAGHSIEMEVVFEDGTVCIGKWIQPRAE